MPVYDRGMWRRIAGSSLAAPAVDPRGAAPATAGGRPATLRARWAFALLGAGSLSCALFVNVDPNAGARALAEEERAREATEQQERDRLIAANIADARAKATAPGRSPADVTGYGRAVLDAHADGTVERGVVDGPSERKQAIAALEGARGEEPATLADRRALELELRLLEGDALGATQLVSVMFAEAPSIDLLVLATELPRTPETSPLVVDVCKGARPLVKDDDGVFLVVERCLPWVDGDGKRLPWKSAKKDLGIYERVWAKRKAEAERLAAAERAEAERAAAERAEADAAAAKAAAEASATLARWQTAGCFAAGRCSFNDCFANGWEQSTSEGTTRTRCNFGKCLSDGWETTFPDGSRANTRCNFGKCFTDGWETTFSNGDRARTRCNFGKCETDGWETTYPDGSSSRTRCNFGKCLTDGWESSHPDGSSTRCRCNFGDCTKNGASCD